MKGLRELYLEICPIRTGNERFGDEDEDVLFECVRALVEKNPGVVNLSFPLEPVVAVRTRWMQAFGIDSDAPLERLRCKAPDTEL